MVPCACTLGSGLDIQAQSEVFGQFYYHPRGILAFITPASTRALLKFIRMYQILFDKACEIYPEERHRLAGLVIQAVPQLPHPVKEAFIRQVSQRVDIRWSIIHGSRRTSLAPCGTPSQMTSSDTYRTRHKHWLDILVRENPIHIVDRSSLSVTLADSTVDRGTITHARSMPIPKSHGIIRGTRVPSWRGQNCDFM